MTAGPDGHGKLPIKLPTVYHHTSILKLSVRWCVYGRERISRSGLTQDIKTGNWVFHCDVPHQWVAQRQVGPVSVYCDMMECHVPCLRHDFPVWQHIGQSTTVGTATSRHRRDMNSASDRNVLGDSQKAPRTFRLLS